MSRHLRNLLNKRGDKKERRKEENAELQSIGSSRSSASARQSQSQRSWIEKVFQKRECTVFISSSKDPNRCGCGRLQGKHFYVKGNCAVTGELSDRWIVMKHTELLPTDAYGTIEFQGGPHPTKAQFVRVAYDTKPDLILQLLQKQWGLELPKLLISVHGGIANFDLQPKLKRVFRKGLLKAAKTTGAWIVTGGTNTGVMRHVGDSLGDTLAQARNGIVTIGIAPWGVVHNRNDLIGKDTVTPYHAIAAPKSNNVVLNSNHSYFILVDNGTVGKYGAEIILRKKLEKYISQQKITMRSGAKNYSTPVVTLILEGGTNTIRTVLECITDTPAVPVVVCDGSGRAADLLAFTHKYAQDDGTMPETLRDQLILTVEKTFAYTREQAEKLFIELMLCVKKKELMTVFRMGEGSSQDIDLAILTALLKGQKASAADQLSLALTWNRVDIARSHIFVYGQEWPELALEQAMMDALVNDRVDFVKLLLENGVSMQKWLSIPRLEELYNIKQEPSSTLHYLIRENKKHLATGYRYTLFDIGLVIEQLMGGAYRASYCRRKFRAMYNATLKKSASMVSSQGHQISNIVSEVPLPVESVVLQEPFKYPFNELMVWAVLMKRQRMARFMWQHGEEALAKALIAMKLYKGMAQDAAQDELDMDVSEELRTYAREFSGLALDLLDHCYKTDDDLTQQLLTYELQNWSNQTLLSLAVSAAHRDFIAHTCCQTLLTEMWMGGLRMRKYTSAKVILGVLFFPSILFLLEFKSKEELQLMPQTMEEHIQELEDSDSDSDTLSSDSDSDDINEDEVPKMNLNRRGRSPKPAKKRVLNSSQSQAALSEPQPNGSLFLPDLSVTFRKKNSPLRLGKKVYEFYTAPITKFWAQTIGYMVFLSIFTFVVLVRMSIIPQALECYIISYLLAFTIEKCREIITSEPTKFWQKLYVHYGEVWNICDALCIILFLIGLILRLISGYELHGRVFYIVDLIFWYIRILDIFSVNKYLGPYVMMIGKMIKDMVKFIVIMLVVLMSFGIARVAIRFPFNEPSWTILKNVYLEPYFMLYGEVYAGTIDPECGDDLDFPCVPGRWVVPAIMAVYLIVANILLINLLIAVFNNTFYQVNAISNQVWKFLRYNLVIEFESKPILPPPFIVICHIYLIVKYIIQRCKGKREYFDNGLKLFLSDDDVEKVHDFEEECVEDYFRGKEANRQSSTEERICQTNERVENMSLRMDDIVQKENSMKLTLQTMDFRLAKLEEISLQIAETLFLLKQTFAGSNRLEQMPSEQSTGSLSSLDPPTPVVQVPSFNKGVSLDAYRIWEPKAKPSSKQNKMNEERLRPFTDYNKPRRPPFSRSITVAAPGHYLPQESSPVVKDFTKAKVKASSKSSKQPLSSYMGSDLYRRRRSRVLSSLRSQGLMKAVNQNMGIDAQSGKTAKSQVTFSNQSSFDSIPISDTVRSPLSESDMFDSPVNKTATDSPVGPVGKTVTAPTVESHNYYTRASNTSPKLTTASRPVSIPVSTSSPNDKLLTKNLRVPKLDSSDMSAEVATNAALAISPIVTPVHSEYTSITDEIDTSELNYESPEGSPSNLQQFLAGMDVDVDLYTKKQSKKKKQKTIENLILPSKYELDQLKNAEESEHEQLENVIRKRMRQISLTESDSLGDIARHIIQEMDMSELEVEAGTGYHSDEGDHFVEEEPENDELGMNTVKSEPLLSSMSASVDGLSWTNAGEASSVLSAPIDMEPATTERNAVFFVQEEQDSESGC